MKTSRDEERIRRDLSDCFDGALSAKRRKEIERALDSDAALRETLDEYRRLREIAADDATPRDDQTFYTYFAAISERLDESDKLRERPVVGWRWAYAVAAAVFVGALGVWTASEAIKFFAPHAAFNEEPPSSLSDAAQRSHLPSLDESMREQAVVASPGNMRANEVEPPTPTDRVGTPERTAVEAEGGSIADVRVDSSEPSVGLAPRTSASLSMDTASASPQRPRSEVAVTNPILPYRLRIVAGDEIVHEGGLKASAEFAFPYGGNEHRVRVERDESGKWTLKTEYATHEDAEADEALDRYFALNGPEMETATVRLVNHRDERDYVKRFRIAQPVGTRPRLYAEIVSVD